MITQEFLKNSPFAQETYQQAARLAAAEAVDCLWSVYWAHSFDGQLLVKLIEAVILPILIGAIPLEVDAFDPETEQPKTPERVYPPGAVSDRPKITVGDLPISQWKQVFYDCGEQ
jgi:hypothetical protein